VVCSAFTCLAQTQVPPATLGRNVEARKKAGGVEIIPIGKPQVLRDSQGRFLDWPVQPKEFVQSAAEGGDVGAMLELASRPSRAESLKAESLKWVSKAANHGSITAMLALSSKYRFGLGTTQSEEQADYWLDRAQSTLQTAWAGNDGFDLSMVAMSYLYGFVPPNMDGKVTVTVGEHSQVLRNRTPDLSLPFSPREAIKWMHRASETGYYQARIFEVGISTNGLVVKREGQSPETIVEPNTSSTIAEQWLKQVEDSRDPMLAMTYANCCLKRSQERLKLLRIAAEAGVQDAMYSVADSYATGADGVKDADAAVVWLQRGIAAGSLQAATRLADEYCKGKLFPKNDVASGRYFAEITDVLLAHPEDDRSNPFYLEIAIRYASGACVQQNDITAFNLLAKVPKNQFDVTALGAELLGLLPETEYSGKNPKFGLRILEKASNDAPPFGPGLEKSVMALAQTRLAEAYSSGTGVPRDYSRAIRYLQTAAKNDSADAMFKLGEMYEQGLGVPKNTTQAFAWYKEASKKGFPAAVTKAAELERKANQERERTIQQESQTASKVSSTAASTNAPAFPTQPSKQAVTTPQTRRSPSVPLGAVKGVHWSSTPIPDSMTVAFSFSKRCLQDSCGDGAWGADIERDSQAAIDGSGNLCESNTTRKGSCGSGNGGRYFVQCKPGDSPKWAALAIYDDGTENFVDGEAIGYAMKEAAEQAAVNDCGQQGCHAVWSHVICMNDLTNAGNCSDSRKGASLDWAAGLTVDGSTTVSPINGGVFIHREKIVTQHLEVFEITVPFSSIRKVVKGPCGPSCSNVMIQANPATPFPTNFSFFGNQEHNPKSLESLYFRSDGEAQAAVDFFECHRALGR